jgi:hypothetical protein
MPDKETSMKTTQTLLAALCGLCTLLSARAADKKHEHPRKGYAGV